MARSWFPDCVRDALGPLVGQIDALDEAIGAIDSELAASVKADETAKRLMTIPGVGPVTASAIVAAIQDAGEFASGREFAAFLGLTPRQSWPESRSASQTVCARELCARWFRRRLQPPPDESERAAPFLMTG